MKIKIICILVFSFLFFSSHFAKAEVMINEIAWMGTVDSQYGEWIELYNDSSSEVNLVDWKLYEAGGDVLIFTLTKTISPNGFLVIERTTPSSIDPLPEINDESGSFAGGGLSNDGEFLVLKDSSGNNIDSLDFSSGWPAGNIETKETMQLDGSSWITASPTPGVENVPSGGGGNSGGGDDPGGGSSSGNSSNDDEEKEIIIKNPTMKGKILSNSLAFVGQPFNIKANILGYSNENVVLGRLYWNFGDGTYFEQKNNFEKFLHTYYYPGEYQLSLEYYAGHFSKEPEVISKMVVKVVPTTVVISKIGDTTDFFIELTNESSNDIDISGWNLKAGTKNFFFPKNTVVLAKKKMVLGSRITGFSFGDKYNLKLYSVTGELISDFNSKIEMTSFKAKTQAINSNNLNEKKEMDTLKETLEMKKEVNPEGGILDFGTDLTASAFLTSEENNKSLSNSQLFFWIFVALLLFSVGIVYYIRQNRNSEKIGDDFEILDE